MTRAAAHLEPMGKVSALDLRDLYEVEAVRINQWINIGFLGLVAEVRDNEALLVTYSDKLLKWHAACVDRIQQDDAVRAKAVADASKKKFGIF